MQDITTFNSHSIKLNEHDNLEISLLNSSLKIIAHDEERIYIESDPINLHPFIISADGSTFYIFDDNAANTDAQLTIFVPDSAELFFKQASIRLENGDFEIAEVPLEESLAETLNVDIINGNIINSSAD